MTTVSLGKTKQPRSNDTALLPKDAQGQPARTRTIQDAQGITADPNLEYVRTLSNDDRNGMAESNMDRALLRSFQNADLN